MFFIKYPHRANFAIADAYEPGTGRLRVGDIELHATVDSFEGDIYRVRVSDGQRWGDYRGLVPLIAPPRSDRQRLKVDSEFGITLLGRSGQPLLKASARGGFGICDKAHIFAFELGGEARFYGMGEKTFGEVELNGKRTKFWNTDVWGDFDFAQVVDRPTDPSYFSTPYVAVKIGEEYFGLLVDNPYATFMETPSFEHREVFVEKELTGSDLLLGSEGGEPNLWVIYGPTLPELTRKLQRLVGITPLPPLWSLGYHQSRWGYGGHGDILEVDAKMAENKIPCDGIWMDLEHMEGFRIFTCGKDAWPDGPQVTADIVTRNRRRIVPILDPGVKYEPGYSVYDDGHDLGYFCLNPHGGEFIGLVWPGETVFPDLSMPEVRDWWANHIVEFRRLGYGSTWVDMNDPSTGPVDPTGMRFKHGTEDHEAYHNQYALAMQMATREGFLRYDPDERPFILSRSGFTGSSRYSAVWTGDNVSNYFYLKISIPTAIGMSLSGLPFSGPDLGGFGGDCTDQLMIDWVKTDFLFPFFRNHSMKGSRPQEPYSFGVPVMEVVRRYIRLRYKLLPYLYNLFVQHTETGDPILRPLFYHYSDPSLEKMNDQFLIGEDILQAPFVQEKQSSRPVLLPGSEPWYDASTGNWVLPGTHTVKKDRLSTPLYIRAGALIPMQSGTPTDNTVDLLRPHIHVFVPSAWNGDGELVYHADDGVTFGFERGERSTMEVHLAVAEGNIALTWAQIADGFGAIEPTFVFHGSPRSVRISGQAANLYTEKVALTGKRVSVQVAR